MRARLADRGAERTDRPFPEVVARPWLLLGVLAAVVLVMSWQFIADPSRAVPAFDTAFYQWRAEFLRVAEPGELIELRGARGALAGGYRVAEPVLGALMGTVGGASAATHTVVLSVFFRILAAAGLAAFAWRHRRDWLLFYVTLVTVPALFLLQRFFGFMDNFLTLSLVAGVLLLLEPMRRSWTARVAATAFLFLGGLSHPTTVVIFLLAMGLVAAYRLLRERSIGAVLRSEGPVLIAGAVAVALTSVFWIGGLWGPRSSFSDAAVPPPETVSYFLNRSLGVLKNLQPFSQARAPEGLVLAGVAVLVGLIVVGLIHAVVRALRDRECLSEVTVAWTLPLAGMFGFLIGAAYPYFRFFNATLAPLLLVALALTLILRWARARGTAPGAVAAIAVAALLAGWWFRGVSEWNSGGTWLTTEIRTTMAAARSYLTEAPQQRAVFVVDAQPGEIVPYGKYKEYVNAVYAGLAPRQIDDVALYFGRVQDLRRGQPTVLGDEVYDGLSADTLSEALPVLRGDAVVLMPEVMNEFSSNEAFLERCDGRCVEIGDTGVFVIPPLGAPLDEGAAAAAADAAEEARSFAEDPPGPLRNLGSTILTILRLGLLFVVPGWLIWRALSVSLWPEGVALIPMLSIAAVTTVGVFLLAVVRQPFGTILGWATWGIAVAVGAVLSLVARRRPAGP